MIACRTEAGSRPRIRSLAGIAERAEEEEVEDHDGEQGHDRDQDPPCEDSSAHSSVHSGGSVLRRPLAMNVDAMIASDSTPKPISTERGVVSQPESRDDGRHGVPPPVLADGGGARLQAEELRRGLEERLAIGAR